MLYFKFKAVRGHQILNCSQHLGAVPPDPCCSDHLPSQVVPSLRNPDYGPVILGCIIIIIIAPALMALSSTPRLYRLLLITQ